MTEPDSGWRVRTGANLLIFAPGISEERREAERREEEREAKAAELAEEQRRQARVEQVGELLMQGRQPRSQEELFQQVSWAQDRQDAIEAQREKAAAELLGKHEPRINRWESEANVAAAEAEREVTPATKSDVRGWQGQIMQLKAKLHSLSGGPSRSPREGGPSRRRSMHAITATAVSASVTAAASSADRTSHGPPLDARRCARQLAGRRRTPWSHRSADAFVHQRAAGHRRRAAAVADWCDLA